MRDIGAKALRDPADLEGRPHQLQQRPRGLHRAQTHARIGAGDGKVTDSRCPQAVGEQPSRWAGDGAFTAAGAEPRDQSQQGHLGAAVLARVATIKTRMGSVEKPAQLP